MARKQVLGSGKDICKWFHQLGILTSDQQNVFSIKRPLVVDFSQIFSFISHNMQISLRMAAINTLWILQLLSYHAWQQKGSKAKTCWCLSGDGCALNGNVPGALEPDFVSETRTLKASCFLDLQRFCSFLKNFPGTFSSVKMWSQPVESILQH